MANGRRPERQSGERILQHRFVTRTGGPARREAEEGVANVRVVQRRPGTRTERGGVESGGQRAGDREAPVEPVVAALTGQARGVRQEVRNRDRLGARAEMQLRHVVGQRIVE